MEAVVVEWFVPGGGKTMSIAPGAALRGEYQLDCRIFSPGCSIQSFKIGGIGWILHQHEVIGQQDGIEIEQLQAAQVDQRCTQGVAGNTDEAHQSLLPGFHGGFQRAFGSHGGLPLLLFDHRVQLDQVQVIGLQALQ